MKITRIAISREDLALSRPYTIAFKTIASVENCFVRIESEDKRLSSWGAGNPSEQVTGESLDGCYDALQAQAHRLQGRDIRELNKLCQELEQALPRNPAARAALDIALHDLFAQYLRIPLVQWFGQCHQSLPTSITIGIKSVAEALAEAEEYYGRGFRWLKVKLGLDPQQDVEVLHKLRERFGSKIHIRVDMNQGYTPAQLNAFWLDTYKLDIELMEQPLPADAVEEMRALPEIQRERIAADECLLSPADALRLAAEPRACGIFNVKLMKCGGLYAAKQIAEIARAAGIRLMWGCNDESIVSITAALHLALALPHTRYLDLDGSLDLARDLVAGGFMLKDGMMQVNGLPGLGLTPLKK